MNGTKYVGNISCHLIQQFNFIGIRRDRSGISTCCSNKNQIPGVNYLSKLHSMQLQFSRYTVLIHYLSTNKNNNYNCKNKIKERNKNTYSLNTTIPLQVIPVPTSILTDFYCELTLHVCLYTYMY